MRLGRRGRGRGRRRRRGGIAAAAIVIAVFTSAAADAGINKLESLDRYLQLGAVVAVLILPLVELEAPFDERAFVNGILNFAKFLSTIR